MHFWSSEAFEESEGFWGLASKRVSGLVYGHWFFATLKRGRVRWRVHFWWAEAVDESEVLWGQASGPVSELVSGQWIFAS